LPLLLELVVVAVMVITLPTRLVAVVVVEPLFVVGYHLTILVLSVQEDLVPLVLQQQQMVDLLIILVFLHKVVQQVVRRQQEQHLVMELALVVLETVPQQEQLQVLLDQH
jgi:hypothetical protein